MKSTIALLGLLSLASCASIYGDGEQIGTTRTGKALYESRCTVDLSTAGREGLFNTGTIPLYGTCQIAASNRCGEGQYTIVSAEQSNRRRLTEVIQTGTMIQRRTYPAVDTVLRFTCGG